MTQHDPDAWLDLARQALSPREADQTRVLAALEQRLALAANDSALRSEHQPQSNLHASSVSLPSIPSALVRWALGAVVPLAGVAAVSVFVATRSPTPKAPIFQPQVTAAAAEPSMLDVLELSLTQFKPEAEAKAPAPVLPAPLPNEKKPRKKCRTAQGKERPCGTAKPTPTAVASTPQPVAASLSAELAALREAQRALREGQPAHALSVLASFEQAAAGPGAMQEERNAATAMARCTLALRGAANSGSAQELYDEFMRAHPKSAYAARLARTCLPKPLR